MSTSTSSNVREAAGVELRCVCFDCSRHTAHCACRTLLWLGRAGRARDARPHMHDVVQGFDPAGCGDEGGIVVGARRQAGPAHLRPAAPTRELPVVRRAQRGRRLSTGAAAAGAAQSRRSQDAAGLRGRRAAREPCRRRKWRRPGSWSCWPSAGRPAAARGWAPCRSAPSLPACPALLRAWPAQRRSLRSVIPGKAGASSS